jgi:outer membrane protein assembly factor BamA
VQFRGVEFSSTDPVIGELGQKPGQPLDPEKVRADLRKLFNTGRYRDIAVYGEPGAGGLTLIYTGSPRYYVGRVDIEGVSSEHLSSLLEFSTKLEPGTAFTDAELPAAIEGIKQALARSGYYQPTIALVTTKDDANQQLNATFTIDVGPQARVGTVAVDGKDPGISVEEFRKKGSLNCSRLTTLLRAQGHARDQQQRAFGCSVLLPEKRSSGRHDQLAEANLRSSSQATGLQLPGGPGTDREGGDRRSQDLELAQEAAGPGV